MVQKYQKFASISKNGIILFAQVYTSTSLESNLAINLKFKMWYTTKSSIPLLSCVF